MNNSDQPLVALIFGGRGYERGVSVKSAEYALSVIDRGKLRVFPIYIKDSGEWLTCYPSDGFTSLSELNKEIFLSYRDGKGGMLIDCEFIPIDCAIPLLHGDLGEDGVVQGALENSRIPYIGCDTICGAVCADKAFTKAVAERLGIPVARYVCSRLFETAEELVPRVERELGYPVFVKPTRLGSSIGASIARDPTQLRAALTRALELSPHVLIEELLSVECELECAYFSANDTRIISDVGGIEYSSGFYDFGSKYEENSRTRVSEHANVSDSVIRRVRKYSESLCYALKIRHLCRLDFFLTKAGDIIFNEINTMPGFTASSLYPRLIERAGARVGDIFTLWVTDAMSSAE